METDRLRQFRVIVETGNLRRAAELLGISHSGLSKSMQVLQNEIGFELLRPSGRGILVTDEGLDLYERSTTFLGELERLLGSPNRQRPSVLRLGSFEVFTSYFIGPLLRDYLVDSDIEIHELVPGRLEEALYYGKIDLGITYEPIPRKGIEFVKVADLRMGTYALKGRFDGTEFSRIPFVVPVSPLEGAPSGVKGRDGWPDEKIERRIRYRVDLMSSGLELARQGLAAIFIPRFVAHLHNQCTKPALHLELLELSKRVGTVRRDVYIVKREAMAEDAAARKVAQALRAICERE